MLEREAVQSKILSTLKEYGKALFIAPTGFGKSTLFIHNLEEIEAFRRIVHCLPLRAVVSDIVRKAYERLGYKVASKLVGYQAGVRVSIEEEGGRAFKNPYLLSVYSITTYDSYSLSLLLSAIPELTRAYAHADVTYMAITSALNLLDEVHILARADELIEEAEEDQLKSFAFLKALTEYFTKLKIPFLYSSATVPPQIISLITPPEVPIIIVAGSYVINKYKEFLGRKVKGFPVEEISSLKEGAELYLSKMFTRVSNKDLVSDVKGVISEGYKNIVVFVNTVPRAAEVYDQLKLTIDDYEIIIIHGRLGKEDRAYRLNTLKKSMEAGRKLIVVSTQVLEAGADLSFDCMVSEISTPESLIQRAGRVLRHKEHLDKSDKGLILVNISSSSLENAMKIYPSNIIRLTCSLLAEFKNKMSSDFLKPFDWRYGVIKETGYRMLLEVYRRIRYNIDYIEELKEDILLTLRENYAHYILGFSDLQSILENFEGKWKGSLVRSSGLTSLVIYKDSLIDTVDVSLELLQHKWREWLEVKGDSVSGHFSISSPGDEFVEEVVEELSINDLKNMFYYPLTGYRKLIKKIRMRIKRDCIIRFNGFLAKPSAYHPEKGLI